MPGTPDAPGDWDQQADRPDGTLQAVGRYGGHGLTLGAATALFSWLGHLIDGWLHTGPLFVILGVVTGFGGGFFAMYRDLVLRSGGDRDPEPRDDSPSR